VKDKKVCLGQKKKETMVAWKVYVFNFYRMAQWKKDCAILFFNSL